MEKDLTVDKYGNSILTVDDCVQLLINGKPVDLTFVNNPDEVDLFNRHAERLTGHSESLLNPIEGISVEDYHAGLSSVWFMPDKYRDIDVTEYLLNKAVTEEEVKRIRLELGLFDERGLFPLLRFLIYLVDFLRSKNIVWGVGRGSSVSSYCLYLIGVHKVDSIKYDLSIEEFLK